jgi:pyridoxal phosphate enzyme (YggS family)
MHDNVSSLITIQKELKQKIIDNGKWIKTPEIIAVSKTFEMVNILPLINHGHLHFGENKVQEAIQKWKSIKLDFKYLNLHMIGKLQTNKVKQAISLFDYIHSLDNLRLARKISEEQIKQNKKPKIFIQVNIGNEENKSGIAIENINSFYEQCLRLNLDIIGTMCIPPKIKDSKNYFLEMYKINTQLKLPHLSMGMSKDYMEATENNSTFLRIGSKIFGDRD